MSDFENFYSWFITRGLEHFRLYYGAYRGIVTRNDDPEARGRIQAIVPSVGQTAAVDVWIDPSSPGAGHGKGMFWPPEPGDSVRVMFEAGDTSRPILYFGGWFGTGEVPSSLGYSGKNPEKRGLTTRAGHSITFDDTAGSESITIQWNQGNQPTDRSQTTPAGKTATIKLDSTGSITLTSKDGASVKLDATGKSVSVNDANGNSIKTDPSGITITDGGGLITIGNGADTFAVRGTDLVTWLTTHVHNTPLGPTTPSTVPLPPTVLSTKIAIK